MQTLTFLSAATQRQSTKNMTSVSAVHIILTPTIPIGGRDQTKDLLKRSPALCRLSSHAPFRLLTNITKGYFTNHPLKNAIVVLFLQICQDVRLVQKMDLHAPVVGLVNLRVHKKPQYRKISTQMLYLHLRLQSF